ncbi:MAG: methyltransferase [Halobacteriovoraceae bacterium]|nr:methyltransferase [Halobacteriovoraceae bacterium]
MIQIKNVLDFCCGNGIIGIEMARSYKGNSIESITFLEKQTEFSEHLNLNLKFLDSSIRVNVVFNDFKDFLTNEKFDLILSNPPFFREGHGRACDNLKKHLCRHQVNFTDDDLISFVRSHLSHTGVGYLILPRALLDKKIEVHPIGKMFINCISV